MGGKRGRVMGAKRGRVMGVKRGRVTGAIRVGKGEGYVGWKKGES